MAASPANSKTIAYFGAWLDINQPTAQFPTKPSRQSAPGPAAEGSRS